MAEIKTKPTDGDVDAFLASVPERLGSHSLGKACLYVKRLDKVDTAVLRELLVASVAHLRATDLR